MKKHGIINGKLMGILAGLGHTDKIVIADAGFPIPEGREIVDLTLVKGIPTFMDVMKAVLNEVAIEKIMMFAPLTEANPTIYNKLNDTLAKQEKLLANPDEFLEEAKSARVVIRTAEITPCCNVILYSASGINELWEPLDVTID